MYEKIFLLTFRVFFCQNDRLPELTLHQILKMNLQLRANIYLRFVDGSLLESYESRFTRIFNFSGVWNAYLM